MKFRIGDISLDDDGTWWCDWHGMHAQQGGPAFSPGNMGSTDLEALLRIVAKNMIASLPYYEEHIQRAMEKDNGRTR